MCCFTPQSQLGWIRIGQPGHYQQQSLRNDKLQLHTPSAGIILNTRLTPYQKTRQVLWLLEKVVNITKRTAPWNLMCSVKRQSIDIKGQAFSKKKGCPHNVEKQKHWLYTTSDL